MFKILMFTAVLAFSSVAGATLVLAASDLPPTGGGLVVLVHGAHLTGASWKEVQTDLYADKHIKSSAPELYNPTEQLTLSQAGQRLCYQIVRQPRPVVLVGHSQGGAIITEAAGQCPTAVRMLIYLTAVFPKPGESPFQDFSQADDDSYGRCADYDPKTATMVLQGFDRCWKVFLGDSPREKAEGFYNSMVSEETGIPMSKADYAYDRIASIPKFYIETLQDQVISLETQRKFESKAPFQKVLSINASHTPFFSQPAELAKLLEEIY
jgi:pimeloyl-ACP methyl ester carboxylesterase